MDQIGEVKINNKGVIQEINQYAAELFGVSDSAQMKGRQIISYIPDYSLEDFYFDNSHYNIQMIHSARVIACSFYEIEKKDVYLTILLYKAQSLYHFFKRIMQSHLSPEERAVLQKLMSAKPQPETAFKKIKEQEGVVGVSKEMQNIFHLIELTANTNANLLLTGETGVGKSMFAKIIHDSSNRSHMPFVDINCGAIHNNLLESELFGYEAGSFTGAKRSGKVGKIEMANHGTLFLDEIGEIPIDMQQKLLQVIQEKKLSRVGSNEYINVDFRLIAATNLNLEDAVRAGRFREDLYYRVNVIPIHIPPIRKRTDDIISLSLRFIRKFNEQYGLNKSFSNETIQSFCSYSWLGNVREMENLIERLVLTSKNDVIDLVDLPDGFREIVGRQKEETAMTLAEKLEAYERELVLEAVQKYKTSIQVGEKLGISQTTAARKIRKYTT